MTTKPLKRHAALVELSKDHHFGLLLVWKIRQGLRLAVDSKRIAAYSRYFFQEDLQHHFHEEEAYLFNLIFQDELSLKARTDHDVLRNLVLRLEKEQDSNLLNLFADTLEQHIRFEERELFRHYQESLTEEQLDSLTRIAWRAHTDPDLNWDDKFWEQPVGASVKK